MAHWTKANIRAYEASQTLKPITDSQRLFGERHCGSVAVRRYRKLYCSDCGALIENAPLEITVLNDCKCENCGAELVDIVHGSAKKGIYYDIVTTHKGLQVIRHFVVDKIVKAGQPARYFIFEAVQNWIDEKGKQSNIARSVKAFSYDGWIASSEMKLKRKSYGYYYSPDVKYDIYGFVQYPRQNFISVLRRNGAKKTMGTPSKFCVELIKNRKFENLLKLGQIEIIEDFQCNKERIERWYNNILLAVKHGFKIEDIRLYTDYLDNLMELGLDTHSPKYLCPENLTEAHEKYLAKIERIRKQKAAAERQKRIQEEEKTFGRRIAKFIGLCIVGNGIEIKPLESVSDFFKEGEAMHHCVYTNGYYKNKNSLILSAKDTQGKRIETIEVDLKKFSIVQSRGVCNKNTERHDEILGLVNENMKLIKKYNKKTA